MKWYFVYVFAVESAWIIHRGRGESGSRYVYWKKLQSRDHKRQQRNGSLLFCKLTQGPSWLKERFDFKSECRIFKAKPPGVYSALHWLHAGGYFTVLWSLAADWNASILFQGDSARVQKAVDCFQNEENDQSAHACSIVCHESCEKSASFQL